MKILTSRNGIALIAVLTMLLVLTLLLPAMFTMSDTATKFSVEGTDRQRASYFARSLCEMAVGNFKATYSAENPPKNSTAQLLQAKYSELLNWCMLPANHGKPSEPVKFQEINMYIDENDEVYYSNQTLPGKTTLVDVSNMEFVGTGKAQMTYTYYEMFLLINLTTGDHWEIESKDDYEDLYEIIKICKVDQVIAPVTVNGTRYTPSATIASIMKKIMGLDSSEALPEDQNFTVSAVKNKIVNFDAEATVRGKRETRKCVIILPTYPAQQNWLLYQGVNVGMSNEVFINPNASTGLTQINYNAQGFDDAYIPQNLLTFSCLGNMRISTEELKEGKYEWDGNKYVTKYVTPEGGTTDNPQNAKAAELPPKASTFVFDVSPGINTTPNGDPSAAIIDGINSADYYNRTQADNFVAFTASNSISMELPIMLLVNPTRASRLGDGIDANYSIYKMVLFQAPNIVFHGQVDMLVSLYDRPANYSDGKKIDARRMSSVVLSAPANSSHTYVNVDRPDPKTGDGKLVRAGKVFFYEDCYLWIINYANDGTGYSDHWYEVAQTVYYRDKDFTRIKIAEAGDVYYFNAEVEKDGEPVGFSLAGYAIETDYLPNYQKHTVNATPWWQVWTKTQQALFGAYIKNMTDNVKNPTYVKEDFHKIGNIYAGTGNPDDLVVPDSDGLYTIWSS